MDTRCISLVLVIENIWVFNKCFLNRRMVFMKLNLCFQYSELNGGECGVGRFSRLDCKLSKSDQENRYKKFREEKRREGFGLIYSDRVQEGIFCK